jgi:hypothetical protein
MVRPRGDIAGPPQRGIIEVVRVVSHVTNPAEGATYRWVYRRSAMRGKLTVLLMMVAASTAGAKTQEPTADEQTQEHPAESRRPLRVLENPYDISSFYR